MTNLDDELPRSMWNWGDIYKSNAAMRTWRIGEVGEEYGKIIEMGVDDREKENK